MASSGSPLADKASKRLLASKNPSCPIVASANQNLTHQIRTGRDKQPFFEVPLGFSPVSNGTTGAQRFLAALSHRSHFADAPHTAAGIGRIEYPALTQDFTKRSKHLTV